MKFLNMGGRIRHFRERKALSMEELAGRVEVSVELLEQIESNQEVPSIGVLIRLSKNLDINVADIFRERPVKKAFEILRASDKVQVSPDKSPEGGKECGYRFTPLTLPSADKHLDAYLIEVPPEQERNVFRQESHPGEEFIYLLEGELAGEVGDEEFRLAEGDSLFLRSSLPHRVYNPGTQVARALTVIYPY